MPNEVKIKDLSQALQIADTAEFPYTQDNGGSNTTFKAPMTQIAEKINEDMTFNNLTTVEKEIVGAINEVNGVWITGTLTAGQTSITLTDTTDSLDNDSILEFFTDAFGVSPTGATIDATNHTVTLTFPEQASNLGVKVRVL